MVKESSYHIGPYFVKSMGLDPEDPTHPKLVFLHGLLGNGLNWVPIARQLESYYSILLLDQRGHGKTGQVEQGGYAPLDFAQDLKYVLDHLKWKNCTLVGHSLGARVAFVFGALYPDLVSKIVFEDMGPTPSGHASESIREMINSVPVPFGSRKETRDFFKTTFESRYGKRLSDFFYSNVSKQTSEHYDWRFHKEGVLQCLDIGQKQSFWEEFGAVRAPNLILRGEHSAHLSASELEKMLKANPHSTGCEVPGAGHWIHADQKEAFVEHVKTFLLEA